MHLTIQQSDQDPALDGGIAGPPATVVPTDAARFEGALRPLLRPAFGLANAILLDRHEAEDAVQDAALKAWRARGQFRDRGAGMRSWFLTIVANECRGRLRSRWWRVGRHPEVEVVADAQEDGIVFRADLARTLRQLSPAQREVLHLFYVLDLPHEEIARIFRVRPGTVKSRLHRAIVSLRALIDEEANHGTS